MAFLRTDDAGLDITVGTIQSYALLVPTRRTATTSAGDVRAAGVPPYTAQVNGFGFSGSGLLGLGGGTVTGLSENPLGRAARLEVTGANVPARTFLNALSPNTGSPVVSVLLGGDDLIQGGAGNDVLAGYGGRNVILGGGGDDIAVIGIDRTATLAYRYRNEAVVFRNAGRQADLLVDVETVRFRDGAAVGVAALAAARPFQYLATYGDLAARFGADDAAGWRHFAQVGLAEGRAVGFSGLGYIASHGDLRAAYGLDAEAGARHFLNSGRAEGRAVTFDGLRYVASHGDLIRVLPRTVDAGAIHFITSGANENRGITFDPLNYIASHRDLIQALGTDEARGVEHWFASGFTEGRSASAFNPAQYLANYADLRAAFRTDLRAATLHFVQSGAAENRVFTPLA